MGDSQAEGVCVPDDKKLHAKIENASSQLATVDSSARKSVVLPLGRSGDDAVDWLMQFQGVENAFGIDVHVLLVAELLDLVTATEPIASTEQADSSGSVGARVLRWIPAFLVHAANMLGTVDQYTPRRLRFSLGPVASAPVKPSVKRDPVAEADWDLITRRIKSFTDQDILVVYAPAVPSIIGGKVVTEDSQSDAFDAFTQASDRAGVTVLDMREIFRKSADAGGWPHGFHNGQIGNGHLNAVGYQLIADAVAKELQKLADPTE